jgi:hypothetical protein
MHEKAKFCKRLTQGEDCWKQLCIYGSESDNIRQGRTNSHPPKKNLQHEYITGIPKYGHRNPSR